MREIKFRAYDKERKEMIYQDKHTCFHIADEFVGIDCDETKDYEYREWSWKGSLNCELMQFTGLKGKNGKEIYEGDIVKTTLGNNLEIGFVDGKFGCVIDGDACTFGNEYAVMKEVEVIGNIYENPELIKQDVKLGDSEQ